MPRISRALLFASWPAAANRIPSDPAITRRGPSPLFRVVKNDSQRVTRAAIDAANSVLHVHTIIAPRAAHRAVARREDDRLPLIGMHHFGSGLRPWLLFD